MDRLRKQQRLRSFFIQTHPIKYMLTLEQDASNSAEELVLASQSVRPAH